MRVWVTRTEPGASATAGRLRDLGHEPFVAPLMSVHDLDATIELAGIEALAFSSAAAVRRFAGLCDARGLPAFTVGDATAAAARETGFKDVRSASGDVGALANLIILTGLRGRILALGPAEPAGDLAGAVERAGIEVRRVALYETRPVDRLPELSGLDAVLIHSPKAGAALARMADKGTKDLAVYALSEACAAPLRAVGFARVQAASAPNEEALLHLLR